MGMRGLRLDMGEVKYSYPSSHSSSSSSAALNINLRMLRHIMFYHY